MTLRDLLLLAHLLVFGAWIGTDLATFTLSRKVLDSTLELSSRRTFAVAMTSIEVIARLCLPTMLTLGLALSIETGLVAWSTSLIPILFLLLAAWLAIVWRVHTSQGESELASKLAYVDLGIRSAVCIAVGVLGVVSLASDGPFIGDWLGAKLLLFAVIIAMGILIRFQLRPFSAAFAALMEQGSTPGTEQRLAGSLRIAQMMVGVIWLSLVSSALFAVLKALPWQ